MFRQVACALVVIGSGDAAVADALDKPAFAASATELLALANAAPAGDWPVVILREDNHVALDDQLRETKRWRLVFVVRSQAGVDQWGTLQHAWSPFYQDKPSVRARVIEPDGKVIELDKSLISDSPRTSTSPTIFSDRRRLEAPLPRLKIGAVVEEEIVIRDRQPVLAAGGVDHFALGNGVPTQSTRAVISAPAARKVHFLARNLPAGVKPQHTIAQGRETWSYEIGPLQPVKPREPLVPSDVKVSAYVGVGAAASWNAVAREYRRLVDKRISDGPFSLPPELPKTPTVETARAIVAWLHRQVRYTGIEFGEASNIPWPPAETVKRGFGDCKDKATLLVALLRQAGFRAELALLQTGPGGDLDRELPGMGVFDHAIVRARIGTRDIWIDATEDLVAVGALPLRDQGRSALVIADDVTALVNTPLVAASQNLVREVRTFELTESGAARVTELSRFGGVFESAEREWLRDIRSDDLQKDLTGYVETEYLAAGVERYAKSDVSNLAIPVELTVVARGARRAYTDRARIDIWLYASDALARVPSLLTTKLAEPRRSELAWDTPHSYEIENRLVIPTGFTMPAPAPDRVRKLGTASLTERHRIDGQTYVVTFRFESGKPRLSAAETTAVVDAIQQLHDDDELRIIVEHTGWALADRGKPREALAEIERLIRLHPKEALHHAQLAYVLIEAGMGTAARRAMRKAIELEPTNADTHVILGWVLRRDSLGREYGFDHDRAGALAAYAKARKLDPKHVGAIVEHATLLERDARGRVFEAGADLKAAVEAWRVAADLEDEHEVALMRALIWSGRFAEAEEAARKARVSELRDQSLVAAIAAGPRGAAAAITTASTLATGAARTKVIDGAGGILLLANQYAASRALFAHTGSLKPGSHAAVLVQKAVRTTARPAASDPKTAVINATRIVIDPGYEPAVFWDAKVAENHRASLVKSGLDARLGIVGNTFLEDMMRSAVEWRIEGPATGPWRADYEVFGQRGTTYVALDRGVAKLLGDVASLDGVGRHALRLLAKQDIAGATRLLEWVRKDADGRLDTFAAVWDAPRDKDSLPLAAALLSGGTAPDVTIPILIRCATSVTTVRVGCDATLAMAYLDAHRWSELDAHALAWAQRQSGNPRIPLVRATALVGLGRFDEAEKIADAFLAKTPGDPQALEMRAHAAAIRGQVGDAIRHYDTLIKANATRQHLNQAAWLRLVESRDLDTALKQAVQGVGSDKSKADSHILNTLAAIEAERGDLAAAKADGWKAIEVGARAKPDSGDWYVVGRIAEQLGLREDAISAYRRVLRRPGLPFPDSHELAQRRLKKLQP